MATRLFLLIACLVAPTTMLRAQCPDRQAVMKRIVTFKAKTEIMPEQMAELSSYVPAMERCPVKNDSVFAYLLQRMGTLYYFAGDYANAVSWSLRAVEVEAPKFNGSPSPVFLIRVYSNLQVFYDSLNLVRKKMEAIDSCIQIAVRNNLVNAEVLYNLWQRVDFSFDIGDYQRCAEYSALGESLIKNVRKTPANAALMAGFFSQRVNSLIHLKRSEEAERMLEIMIEDFRKRGDEKNCGAFYNQLADISTQNGDYARSTFFLLKSLKCNQLIKYKLGCKQSYNNVGFLYLKSLKQPDTALYYFNMALAIKRSDSEDLTGDIIETSNIYGNIGNAYSRKNMFDSALLFYQKAFDQVKQGMDEGSMIKFSSDQFIANKKMQYLTTLIKDKGDAFLRQYKRTGNEVFIQKAISIYKSADQAITRVKSEQSDVASGIAWRSNARNLYEQAIEACFLNKNPGEAFYFFEKSRAALLNDQVNETRRSTSADIKKQVTLKQKLKRLQNKLSDAEVSSVQYADLQKQIFSTTQENDRLLLNIKSRDPLYYRHYIDTDFVSTDKVKEEIAGRDRLLVELFYGDSAVYVLRISEKTESLTRINRAQYDGLTLLYTNYLSDPLLLNKHFDDFVRTAFDLHSLIFAGSRVTESRVIVSPDGQYFPFESLITAKDARSPKYFLHEHAVSYAYSAQLLRTYPVSSEIDTAKFLLGLAPVHFSRLLDLPDLPASDLSLERICSIFKGSEEITRDAATRSTFLDNFYKYKVIQLYTHAIAAGDHGVPEIYFSDSSLLLTDINPVFRPATKMVVLSACETGKGTFYKGEGVFSFNRAFASIGIPSSMVNLWSVDNQAAYEITELFYSYMARGLPLDISLQKAKIEFLAKSSRDRSLPYYWAAAIVVGDTHALAPAPSSVPWAIIALLIIPLVIVPVALIRRSKNRRY